MPEHTPRAGGLEPRLLAVALDLRWTTEPEAWALFRRVDPVGFEGLHHNAAALVRGLDAARAEALSRDPAIEGLLARVEQRLAAPGRCAELFPETRARLAGRPVAYFSAEYGIHESLPIYTGGLGVLAGDHLKSAMDLDLPLVAVGLLYRSGPGLQRVDREGWQEDVFPAVDPADLPVARTLDTEGTPLVVHIAVGSDTVAAQVWLVRVGTIQLYLLDTNCNENAVEDRTITDVLYGGDGRRRIRQEVVLGLGGLRILDAMGIAPSLHHLNEGHATFAALGLLCREIEGGASWEAALARTRARCAFTTHTPVPAGHDVFPEALAAEHLRPLAQRSGTPLQRLLDLGRTEGQGPGAGFNMTAVAVRLAAHVNGVSRIHAEVSTKLLQPFFPASHRASGSAAVRPVTNGVHATTWLAAEVRSLLDQAIGPAWRARTADKGIYRALDRVDDASLWSVRRALRAHLVRFARREVRGRFCRLGLAAPCSGLPSILDPDALTIGFARRFAPYKRALLAFHDPDRLARILCDPARPVQLVYAGKAHPHNEPGKRLLQRLMRFAEDPRFRDHVVFLEGYDIATGRALVQGVDVWLNNPVRPLEASGTSGMKAAMNGALNLSILDGWWPEAYDGAQGWAIGGREIIDDPEQRDRADAESLYTRLEQDVVPLFYDRDEQDLPGAWLRKVRAAMKVALPGFCAARMIGDYLREVYVSGRPEDPERPAGGPGPRTYAT